jgi:hypothetical protein
VRREESGIPSGIITILCVGQGGPLRERETDSHIDIHKENPQMVEALIILGPRDCVYLLWNGMFELVGSSAVIIIIMGREDIYIDCHHII